MNKTMQSPKINRNSNHKKIVKPNSKHTQHNNQHNQHSQHNNHNNNNHNNNHNNSRKTHKKHQSLPPQRSNPSQFQDDDDVDDEDEEDEVDEELEDSDDDSMSASPLSTGVVVEQKEDDNEMKYIDDEDLTTTKIQPKLSIQQDKKDRDNQVIDDIKDDDDDDDSSEDDYGIANVKPEPKSAAERTAMINNQRRKSSLLLRQNDIEMLQKYEANKQEQEEEENKEEKEKQETKIGNFLPVGATNMDPYLLFWNNSKKGESVVKVVQDIILMSISKEIHFTHFGFGEFAILASVSNESEMRRILKKILNKVSSNVSTQKLGPVTLCAGLSIYIKNTSISQWVNQCRQACRLAKTNGRGRIAKHISSDNRRRMAVELMLEIKKPRVDFSGARVLELIRGGADLNAQFKYDTALMVAIKKKNEIALRYIIQYDYNPNVQDKKGRTSLILALEKECDAIILDLLVSKRDLNPRIKDYNGNTALSIALRKGYRDIAKTLILLGSEPLLGEKTVLNQWFSASRMGKIETIETMLDNMSFPIDMIDNEDMTSLMLACSNGHNKLVQYLIKRGANVNIQGHRGYTALMFAIENGKILIFSELIQLQDILIGLQGDDGTTILMCAAKGQMPAVVNVALNKDTANVNINAQNFDGNTALMIACQYDSVAVATDLLRNHCDLDIKNKHNQNALILCAKYGSPQIAAMLCTLGSNIDERDDDGKTALIYAAQNGYTGIVVNLIKYGADIDIKDEQGLNALEYANKYGRFEIVKMIKSGTLQDVTDILQQMEILKQKNKALAKNVSQLTEMNQELSDRVNATELAKNQIQKKLQDTMTRMKTQFSIKSMKTNHHSSSSPTSKSQSRSQSKSPHKISSPKDKIQFPKMNVNLKDTFSGMKVGMTGMMDKFNRQFADNNSNNNNNDNKQPSKDIQL